ncbi:MAG: 4-phosphoerythronate dehydrogenase [Porticoccaceae bacterium]|nr:4-phosphoerythronate dehydrogenase [Porticoccaceae bacterium]
MTNTRLKIVADQNMPMVEMLFSPFGDVTLMAGRSISAADIVDADVLLVRSVTLVNETLLAESAVKFVGSATIGIDHIDIDYLRTHGIHFAFAPGCNAAAVVQYDLSVMSYLDPYWQHKNIGIVGCGNVGGLLFRTLKALDVNCHVYDPFLNNDDVPLSDFDSVLRCDIVCLHTPLTYDGPFPTHHLFDQNVLNRLNSSALLINAGRGDVVDKAALLRLLNTQSELQVALDVWSDEPQIDLELLHKISIGTPHIAGYSREGKINGTKMIFEAFTEWLPKTVLIEPYEPLNYVEIACQRTHSLSEILLASYNVLDDDLRMRQSLLNISEELGSAEVAAIFDDLRKTYPTRIQYDWTIISSDGEAFSGEQRDQLQKLGFKLTDNL